MIDDYNANFRSAGRAIISAAPEGHGQKNSKNIEMWRRKMIFDDALTFIGNIPAEMAAIVAG